MTINLYSFILYQTPTFSPSVPPSPSSSSPSWQPSTHSPHLQHLLPNTAFSPSPNDLLAFPSPPRIGSSLSTHNSLSLNNSQHSLYPLLSQPACSLSSLTEVIRRCTSAPPSVSTISDPDQPEHSGAHRPKSVRLLPPAVVTAASQDTLSFSSRRPASYCDWEAAAPPDLPPEAEEKKMKPITVDP